MSRSQRQGDSIRWALRPQQERVRIQKEIRSLRRERRQFSIHRVEAVLVSTQEHRKLPLWIKRFGRADETLRLAGVDFVITADDDTELYLQVKSSKYAAENFLQSHAANEFAVIHVRFNLSDEQLLIQVVSALTVLRALKQSGHTVR